MQDHERKYHQLETKNNNQEENNIVHHGQSMFAVFETQSNQNQEMVENNNEDEKDQTITKPIQPNQKTDNTLEPMVDDAYTLEALDNDFIDGTENTQEHQGYNCLSRQWFEDFGDSYTETELKKHMRDILLKRSAEEPIYEYVDKNVGYDLWAKFLFCFGKDCTKPISSHRPRMGSVNDALESLIRGEPQSIALQVSLIYSKACYNTVF